MVMLFVKKSTAQSVSLFDCNLKLKLKCQEGFGNLVNEGLRDVIKGLFMGLFNPFHKKISIIFKYEWPL